MPKTRRGARRSAASSSVYGTTEADLLLQVHLAEKGHAAAVIPGLLLTAIPPPAVRAFRAALGEAVRATAAVRAAAEDDLA